MNKLKIFLQKKNFAQQIQKPSISFVIIQMGVINRSDSLRIWNSISSNLNITRYHFRYLRN